MSRTLVRSTTKRWAKSRASPSGCGQNRGLLRRTPRPYSRYALRRPSCHPQFWLATRTRVIMLGTLNIPPAGPGASPGGEAREQHSDEARHENAVERACATDGHDGRAKRLHLVQIQE